MGLLFPGDCFEVPKYKLCVKFSLVLYMPASRNPKGEVCEVPKLYTESPV